jgi:hypothetical protein
VCAAIALFVLELRCALLDERRHAFLLVVGGKQQMEHPPLAAMVSATFIASSLRLAAGTTRATSPARSASAASIIRPVRIMSIALALPIAWVMRCVPPMPGMTPSLISG